jgi:hypothetical protein
MIGVVAEAVHGDLTASGETVDAGHPDSPVPTPEPPPVAGAVPLPGDDGRPFTEVLAEWMTEHRAHRFEQAAELRRTLVARLGRLGSDHE